MDKNKTETARTQTKKTIQTTTQNQKGTSQTITEYKDHKLIEQLTIKAVSEQTNKTTRQHNKGYYEGDLCPYCLEGKLESVYCDKDNTILLTCDNGVVCGVVVDVCEQ